MTTKATATSLDSRLRGNDEPPSNELRAVAAEESVNVTAFLEHLVVERRASPNTLDGYRRDLEALAGWATTHGFDIATLTGEQLRAFVAAEHRRGLSPTSLQRRLSACRSFYRWLLKHGVIAASPALAVKAPKARRRLPQVLDPDEAKALVEVPTDAPLGLRDRALLELFYSSGLRLSELCALRWHDLQLEDGLVTVLGKGRKQRSVPVGSHARAALAAWRADQRPAADAPVFPGRNGPLTPRAVQLRLRNLAQRQGLFKRVHPHLLRHSFASHVLESSGDLRGVQELLGHADIATTQIYTHLDFQHLAKVYDAAHPRARRKTRAGTTDDDADA
jgi:integrase/recombinase XerC